MGLVKGETPVTEKLLIKCGKNQSTRATQLSCAKKLAAALAAANAKTIDFNIKEIITHEIAFKIIYCNCGSAYIFHYFRFRLIAGMPWLKHHPMQLK